MANPNFKRVLEIKDEEVTIILEDNSTGINNTLQRVVAKYQKNANRISTKHTDPITGELLGKYLEVVNYYRHIADRIQSLANNTV